MQADWRSSRETSTKMASKNTENIDETVPNKSGTISILTENVKGKKGKGKRKWSNSETEKLIEEYEEISAKSRAKCLATRTACEALRDLALSFEHSHSQVMTSQHKLTCDHLRSPLIRALNPSKYLETFEQQ